MSMKKKKIKKVKVPPKSPPEKVEGFVWCRNTDDGKSQVNEWLLTTPYGEQNNICPEEMFIANTTNLEEAKKKLQKVFFEYNDSDDLYDNEAVDYDLYKISIERVAKGKLIAKRDVNIDIENVVSISSPPIISQKKVKSKSQNEEVSDVVDLIDLG